MLILYATKGEETDSMCFKLYTQHLMLVYFLEYMADNSSSVPKWSF